MSKRMSIRASFSSANGMSEALIRNNPNNRILPEILKHRLLNSAEETVNKLQSIWKEAGYEDSECHRLLGEILEKVNNIFAAELSTEQQIIEHARVEVDTKIKLFVQFSRQLGRDSEPFVSNIAPMNLTDKLSELENLIHKISSEVEQRQNLMDIELAAINKLADLLDEPPLVIDCGRATERAHRRAFRRTAGKADDIAAGDIRGELRDDRADPAGGARQHHAISRSGIAAGKQPGMRTEAGHPENLARQHRGQAEIGAVKHALARRHGRDLPALPAELARSHLFKDRFDFLGHFAR
eukprot:gene41953-56810_t